MKFFIDTANLDQIREAKDLGILDGVTTNPSLMAKEGIAGTNEIMAHYKTICEIVDGDISAEVLSTTYEEMIKEGEELAAAGFVGQGLYRAPRHPAQWNRLLHPDRVAPIFREQQKRLRAKTSP